MKTKNEYLDFMRNMLTDLWECGDTDKMILYFDHHLEASENEEKYDFESLKAKLELLSSQVKVSKVEMIELIKEDEKICLFGEQHVLPNQGEPIDNSFLVFFEFKDQKVSKYYLKTINGHVEPSFALMGKSETC